MIIDNLIKQGSKILKKQNIDSHQIDAELLLSKAIRKDRVFLLTNDEYKVSQKETSDYLNFILRRKHREPLSYITKRKEFWSLGFNVNHNVLIPRPETETIVEQVVRRFKNKSSLNILDIGTGSGCILLSILKELKNSYGIGIDKSFKALTIAKKNSRTLNLLQRAKFIHCDVDNFNFGTYDVVVSNPPYICSRRIGYLEEDIKDFEPRMALDGGRGGLETITKVVIKAKRLLKTRGQLFMEIGNGQSHTVSSVLIKNGFRLVKKFFDYNKTIRCIMSTKVI
ncbi:MAG: peptide chain release factor N(5)-glutamine methyltransferase [Pelagibacteraceae bacterium]|jgi:release factor glutamine methyltransferase|nr:peptide chain release factor N(5)-glutamine methyltransferase [Pelagibacteraceae bacterium]|tara:strand:- start:2130 stop:2975 length:846 start_codon:yes stop_codon:yes gene_type:complete